MPSQFLYGYKGVGLHRLRLLMVLVDTGEDSEEDPAWQVLDSLLAAERWKGDSGFLLQNRTDRRRESGTWVHDPGEGRFCHH
jgi:hypothetical protein